jgi:hypothetical protein
MLRNILSIVAGVLVGIIVLFCVELTGHLISPPPAINFNDIEAMKAYTANAPSIVFIMLIAAYMAGSFVGGLVAGTIAKQKKLDNALSVGGILLGLGTYNLFSLPHPMWVVVSGIIVFIPFAWIGGKLAENRIKNKS